jgi:leader peptidase (prepilin peptidase)/N-methyltransferase
VTDAALVLPLILFAFGACVGSFLNVVIYRLPREDLSVAKPRRSFCPGCKRQIPAYENVPIVSWLLLGGRCRGCKAEIPVRYLVVEIATAVLFAGLGWSFTRHAFGAAGDWIALVASLALAASCVAVTFIDIDWKIIPDEITWPGMVLGVVASAAAPPLQATGWLFGQLVSADSATRGGLVSALVGQHVLESHFAAGVSSVVGLLVGALSVLAVGVLGKLAFRKEAMGLGDVKFMGMVGAFLGCDGVLLVFFLGCVLGAVGGLLHRLVTGDRYIAFGPYLSLGVLLTQFFRGPIVHFLFDEWPRFVQGFATKGG